MLRIPSLTALLRLTIVVSLCVSVGYVIGGLNAIYVAKALADADATSLPDLSRRIGNGFSYFGIAGISALIFLASTFAVWHQAKQEEAVN